MPMMAQQCKGVAQSIDFCSHALTRSADWHRPPMHRNSPSWREVREYNAAHKRTSIREMSAEDFDAMIAAVIDEAAEDYRTNPELTVFHALDGEELVFSGGRVF